MENVCFFELENVYDNISEVCLKNLIEDVYGVEEYRDVLMMCYDVLVMARKHRANKKDEDLEGINKLDAIFQKAYFSSKYDGECFFEDRVSLCEWEKDGNAYKKLQDFSFRENKGRDFDFIKYADVLDNVLIELKKRAPISAIKEALLNSIEDKTLFL